jgi:hypothetical protein
MKSDTTITSALFIYASAVVAMLSPFPALSCGKVVHDHADA